jgi:hypothetical protein
MSIIVRLPARELAVAWTNVSLASATKKATTAGRAATVAVEIYGPSAVRLVASDGALLLTSWVGAGAPDPGRDANPTEAFIAADDEGLAKGFMAHLIKATKADDEQWREVTISVKDATLPDVPAFDGMAKRVCIIETEDYLVQLALVETPLPSWRAAWPTPGRQAPVERVAIAPDYLAALGKLKDTRSAVRLMFHTAKGPVVIHADGDPAVAGLVMPMALGAGQIEVEQLQALWDSES